MKIYIDESGNFEFKQFQRPSVSCVGALIIPDCHHLQIMQDYEKIRQDFPKDKGEVKGRLLNENQIARIIHFLGTNDVLYEVNVVDMNRETFEGLQNHQNLQAAAIVRGIHTFPAHLHNKLRSLQQELLGFSPQQYVQFNLQTSLLERVLHNATMYYVQRHPEELGQFQWIMDAKQSGKITPVEKWWRDVIEPFLAFSSKQNPIQYMIGEDYSYFDKLTAIRTPPYNDGGIQLKKVFSNFRFEGNITFGIELVDILTNSVRRALIGNLNQDGWGNISTLIIKEQKESSVRFLTFSQKDDLALPYLEELSIWNRTGKSMFLKN